MRFSMSGFWKIFVLCMIFVLAAAGVAYSYTITDHTLTDSVYTSGEITLPSNRLTEFSEANSEVILWIKLGTVEKELNLEFDIYQDDEFVETVSDTIESPLDYGYTAWEPYTYYIPLYRMDLSQWPQGTKSIFEVDVYIDDNFEFTESFIISSALGKTATPIKTAAPTNTPYTFPPSTYIPPRNDPFDTLKNAFSRVAGIVILIALFMIARSLFSKDDDNSVKPAPVPPIASTQTMGTQPIVNSYAGMWQRFKAVFLDGLIITLSFVIFIAIGMAITGDESEGGAGFALGQVLNGLFAIAYYIYFIGSSGQTPGKRVFKVKIVRSDGQGRVGYGKAFLRYIGYFVSYITLGLGFLWIAIDGKKQGFHDKIAGTLAVDTRTSGVYQPPPVVPVPPQTPAPEKKPTSKPATPPPAAAAKKSSIYHDDDVTAEINIPEAVYVGEESKIFVRVSNGSVSAINNTRLTANFPHVLNVESEELNVGFVPPGDSYTLSWNIHPKGSGTVTVYAPKLIFTDGNGKSLEKSLKSVRIKVEEYKAKESKKTVTKRSSKQLFSPWCPNCQKYKGRQRECPHCGANEE